MKLITHLEVTGVLATIIVFLIIRIFQQDRIVEGAWTSQKCWKADIKASRGDSVAQVHELHAKGWTDFHTCDDMLTPAQNQKVVSFIRNSTYDM